MNIILPWGILLVLPRVYLLLLLLLILSLSSTLLLHFLAMAALEHYRYAQIHDSADKNPGVATRSAIANPIGPSHRMGKVLKLSVDSILRKEKSSCPKKKVRFSAYMFVYYSQDCE